MLAEPISAYSPSPRGQPLGPRWIVHSHPTRDARATALVRLAWGGCVLSKSGEGGCCKPQMGTTVAPRNDLAAFRTHLHYNSSVRLHPHAMCHLCKSVPGNEYMVSVRQQRREVVA